MPKCDFIGICNFIEIRLWPRCYSVNLLHIFRIPFLQNTTCFYFGLFSLNWAMVTNFQPNAVCIGPDHELKKAAQMPYNNYCKECIDLNKYSKT